MHPTFRKCRFCGRVRISGVLQSLTELTTEQADGRKSANEPKWEYPLTMVLQGVNIDAFGFSHCKRTQFAVVRDGKRPGSYPCRLLPRKPRAIRLHMCGPRREELGATAKKRANEANCCQPLVTIGRWRLARLGLPRRKGNKGASTTPLPRLDVAEDCVQIVIEPGRVGIADFSNFLDDRVVHGLLSMRSSGVQMIGGLRPAVTQTASIEGRIVAAARGTDASAPPGR